MRELAIIGRGKTRKYTAYEAGRDYWAFNDNARTVPINRLAGVFEMHPDWRTRYNGIVGCEGYTDWLQQAHSFPIWMWQKDEAIPNSRRYPREAMPRQFFTSTVSYALALALHMEYDRIWLYGIEADRGTEYESSRDAIFYWMGRAEGAGVPIILHPDNKLFEADLYPPKKVL